MTSETSETSETTTILAGTTKGLFVGRRGGDSWVWEGPHFPMVRVAAVAVDARRDRPRWLVGGMHEHWGPLVARSDDEGGTWVEEEQAALRLPAASGAAVAQVWQLTPGPVDRPDEVWAGVEPAALFRSTDGGVTFSLVESLWEHPHRPTWHPGFGGLCLHTVLPHPERADSVLVAISTGGVYRTDDGGVTWAPSNQGIQAPYLPDPSPEYGQCVHKVARMSGRPDHLLLQNHGGVFRSSDDGRTWEPATQGLPADFGFGLTTHPTDPDTGYLFPLRADTLRLPPDGKARVYRTTDFGTSWHPLADGLPDHGFQTVVLRDALTNDGAADPTLAFGTRSGEVWTGVGGGSSWQQAAAHLPDVLCVRAVA